MTALAEHKRVRLSRFSAATDTSGEVRAAPESMAIPVELLDGGEIVILAIKPSLWFLVFDSSRWLLTGIALLILSTMPSLPVGGHWRQILIQAACLVIVLRLGIALLRWVSRFYVLTNRRVMRLRGVFTIDILSCPLIKIRNTRVTFGPHEKVTGLGTIEFYSEEMPGADLHWYHIRHCDEVHARVRRAIEKAIDSQPHI